ncbi:MULTISPECIES: DUF4097 family beta strand repeat-containing protein [Streptomyces]|uniref:DUF4097 family beta strand repeat-containing protein n=1 Tax=Streptomyces TaxID=1883 RepID=UPI000765D42E|nr:MULTISPECIES: DUF4097 family beta strand repeat-containing protein [Streptomyces]WUB58923.1 DUF4097 domain-containing protein [Streptomyces griseorubiginosus]
MSTEKTFTATTAGRIFADLISHVGTVNVFIEPSLKNAEITVRTSDNEGPLADAVNGTTRREYDYNGTKVLEVRVPRVEGGVFAGGTNVVQIGGSRFSFNGGVINTGTMTGVTISNGDIWVGGQRVVSGGRVVAEQGAVVGGSSTGTITVDVKVPSLSSFRLDTTSADLTVHGGDLQILEVKSVSGDVDATAAHTLRADMTSGDLNISRVEGRADLHSVSGDIEIGLYRGSEFRANAVSGDIDVRVHQEATGEFSASTVSGDVTTTGADHLRPRVSTISGKHRRR